MKPAVYAIACGSLSALFAARVPGQAVQRWAPQPWLPPFDAFQGSRLPYWLLLFPQVVILMAMLGVARRIQMDRLRPSRRAGRWLAGAGTAYMAGALGRIVRVAGPGRGEEPLRAGDYAGMARIALDSRIILDESMARPAQLGSLPGPAGRWLVNLRVSKMGGLLRSLEFLRQARHQGIRVIVGAHVGETSLLTRAALTVAAAAGDALVAQEGAFGTHLLERDVVDPPLMFGPGGILDPGAALGTAPGWGLACREDL